VETKILEAVHIKSIYEYFAPELSGFDFKKVSKKYIQELKKVCNKLFVFKISLNFI